MTVVRVPASMEQVTGGRREVEADGATVRELIASLDEQFPGVAERLIDDSGLRRYVNIYLGGTEVRFLSGLATEVPSGALVTILPAIAGG